VGAGGIVRSATDSTRPAGGAARVHLAQVGHGQAVFLVVEGGGLGEHVADAVVAVVDLAVVADGLAGEVKNNAPASGGSPVVRVLDLNGDGELTGDEINLAPESLKKLDRNSDGRLSRDEWTPASTQPANRSNT
jgi:hypothetical protein